MSSCAVSRIIYTLLILKKFGHKLSSPPWFGCNTGTPVMIPTYRGKAMDTVDRFPPFLCTIWMLYYLLDGGRRPLCGCRLCGRRGH